MNKIISISQPITAYFFAPVDRKLRHGDNREIVLGLTHQVARPIQACHNGLHASERPIDALQYAPGPLLYKVQLYGEVDLSEKDKVAAEYRRYVTGGNDSSEILRKFARECALEHIDKWKCPSVVKDWLMTGDEKIKSAAESAAESAAWSAARSAARRVARSAAESAAWRVAESAAWRVAWSAAESAQNEILKVLYETILGE